VTEPSGRAEWIKNLRRHSAGRSDREARCRASSQWSMTILSGVSSVGELGETIRAGRAFWHGPVILCGYEVGAT